MKTEFEIPFRTTRLHWRHLRKSQSSMVGTRQNVPFEKRWDELDIAEWLIAVGEFTGAPSKYVQYRIERLLMEGDIVQYVLSGYGNTLVYDETKLLSTSPNISSPSSGDEWNWMTHCCHSVASTCNQMKECVRQTFVSSCRLNLKAESNREEIPSVPRPKFHGLWKALFRTFSRTAKYDTVQYNTRLLYSKLNYL